MLKFLIPIISLFLLLSGCSGEPKESLSKRGFKYIVHHDEPGEKAAPGDYVLFEIYMRHGDRTLTSSRKRNQKARYKIRAEGEETGSIPAWVDIIPLMSIGDSVSVFSPADSLSRLPRGVKSTDMLQYDLVLTDIMDQEAYKVYRENEYEEKLATREQGKVYTNEIYEQTKNLIEQYDSGSLGNKLIEGKNGVKYIIHEYGVGEKPMERDNMEVHYIGLLHKDRSLFDSSYRGGRPFMFPLGMGRAVQAWDETFPEFPEGTKATLFIPSEMGYGITGNPPYVPENADLVVYVEILSITSF